jgi:hypothetical protein
VRKTGRQAIAILNKLRCAGEKLHMDTENFCQKTIKSGYCHSGPNFSHHPKPVLLRKMTRNSRKINSSLHVEMEIFVNILWGF